MAIDQFHDKSFKRLFRLIQEHPQAEQHIKTASVDYAENENRPDTAFAWQERRLFPIDSPSEAALSRLYMEKQANIPDRVRKLCDKALEVYGIEMPLQTKTAAAPENPMDYLLPDIKRFRVKTADDAKTAADAILQQLKGMDAVTRTRACVNLVKKATALETKLPMEIYKLAGATVSFTPRMKDWLEARAVATDDPHIRGAYEKLAEYTGKQAQFLNNTEELIKVADAISELDEAANLTRFYDKSLPDPVRTVFNTEKIAEETMNVAGRDLPLSTLLSVDPEIYKDVFGDDLAEDFISGEDVDPEQLKIILPTVPLDLKQALVAQMGL